jgi:hypothetical protein
MKTQIKIKITKDTLRKIEKIAHRKVIVEAGIYAIPTHKVHKSVKNYTRKDKHKTNYAICY